MKTAIFVFSLCALAFGQNREKLDEIKQKMVGWGIECQTEVGASKDDMMQLLEKQVPTSHEGKCVLFCIHKKMQTQDEAGNIVKGKSAEAVTKDITKAAMGEEWSKKAVVVANKCDNEVVQDADGCITAANMLECFMKEGSAAGLIMEGM